MDQVTRIGVSLEPELLKQFDDMITKKGYVSRSEAIRDLVRDSLAENDWKNQDQEMLGIIVIVFDSTVNNIYEKIDDVRRRWKDIVMYTSTVDLDSYNKVDTVTAKGSLGKMKELSSELMSIKGVKRAKLTMAAPMTGNLHHIGLRN